MQAAGRPLSKEDWAALGHGPVEHVGGPYHLQKRTSPPGTNQGVYEVYSYFPGDYMINTVARTYELRTIRVLGQGIVWVGYVFEGYWA
jgi:hypothetical protein